jgi:hypothetical protein
MPPVAAALLPHPPVLVPELAGGVAAPELDLLRGACREALEEVLAAGGTTILIGDGPVWGVPAPGAVGSFRPYGADVEVRLPGVAAGPERLLAVVPDAPQPPGPGGAGPAAPAAAPGPDRPGAAAPAAPPGSGRAGPPDPAAARAPGRGDPPLVAVPDPAGWPVAPAPSPGPTGPATAAGPGEWPGNRAGGEAVGAGAVERDALPEPVVLARLPLSLAVAAWLLAGARARPGRLVARVVPAALGPAAAAAVGRALAGLDEPVGLVVMGDLSARRTARAPGAFHPAAAGFDAGVAAAIRRGRPGDLLGMDLAMAAELRVEGRVPLQVLAGAFEGAGRVRGRILYDDAPYGVGYLVGVLTAG